MTGATSSRGWSKLNTVVWLGAFLINTENKGLFKAIDITDLRNADQYSYSF